MLEKSDTVKVEIYNLAGEKVTQLYSGILESGYHSMTWDASNVSSGIYICKIITSDGVINKKLTLLK